MKQLKQDGFSGDIDAIDRAAKSVLMLEVFDENDQLFATGSGFVAFDNSTLITNYHVVEDSSWIRANSDDGYQYTVTKIYVADEEKDIEFKFIGEPAELSEKIGQRTAELEKKTEGRPYRLNIAFNYGGRAEIVRAVNRLIESGAEKVCEDDISREIYTFGRPEPDLIVRTGREMRISNFLLWQCAYSELYFSDKMWPDYTSDDVDEAVISFAKRKRRWGGLNEDK
jgi:undecaprenyl diphosphate synthase